MRVSFALNKKLPAISTLVSMMYGPGMTIEDAREVLERWDDDLINALFNRARYPVNEAIYEPGKIPIKGFDGSYSSFIHRSKQEADAKGGRFLISGQMPFFDGLPESQVEREDPGYPLGPSAINLNSKIQKIYVPGIPRRICKPGDDGNYGEAANCDALAKDGMSIRAHKGGIAVADIKVITDLGKYRKAVALGWNAVMDLLTVPPQEEKVLKRAFDTGEYHRMDPTYIQLLYREKIIPLTKEVEALRVFEVFENNLYA